MRCQGGWVGGVPGGRMGRQVGCPRRASMFSVRNSLQERFFQSDRAKKLPDTFEAGVKSNGVVVLYTKLGCQPGRCVFGWQADCAAALGAFASLQPTG